METVKLMSIEEAEELCDKSCNRCQKILKFGKKREFNNLLHLDKNRIYVLMNNKLNHIVGLIPIEIVKKEVV